MKNAFNKLIDDFEESCKENSIHLFNVIDPDTKKEAALTMDNRGYWYIGGERLNENVVFISGRIFSRYDIYVCAFVDMFKGMTCGEFGDKYFVQIGDKSETATIHDNIRIFTNDIPMELVYESMSVEKDMHRFPLYSPTYPEKLEHIIERERLTFNMEMFNK